MAEKLRLDKYLWAIRIFKTRTLATSAIDEGKVKWNGNNVKPAKVVTVGERYEIKTPARKWSVEVTSLLHNRVNFEEAQKCYIDHTTAEDRIPAKSESPSFYTGKRMSKTGRPSKKQRRNMNDHEDLNTNDTLLTTESDIL